MGHGIAQAFAMKGYDVNLLSRNKDSLDRAVQEIKWSLDKFAKNGAISSGDIGESVSENMELKKDVFSKIDELAPSHAIIASNTSTLSVTEMGQATQRSDQTLGMHWFIPL